MVSKKNKARKFETFRLEDRVLFEAAAAAEIVEASENVAEAQNEDKNQNQDKEESFADVHVDAGLDVDEESDFSGSSLPLLPEDLDDADNMYESLLDGEIPDHSDMDDMVLNSFVEDIVREIAIKVKEDKRITWFSVEAENFESIHNHSAYAFIEQDNV